MIYLSAQPDSLYFLWQIEVQILNFSKVGIRPDQMHILIGFDPRLGINNSFLKFQKKYKKNANFHFYPDERKNSVYKPSIRPHIIGKHFSKYPDLNNETIFYHDSDIIFRELLNEKDLSVGNTWYVSDTKSYINTEYIVQFSKKLLSEMCKVVGIDQDTVVQNDNNAGGAQYVLKGINHEFWGKIERDSERLYDLLNTYNRSLTKNGQRKIQAWCADMWAIFWNGLLFGHEIKITDELNFCWPLSPKEKWFTVKILHNAGVLHNQHKRAFCKGLYQNSSPYFDDLSKLDTTICSDIYVSEILAVRNKINRRRISHFTIYILFRKSSALDVENLQLNIRYIQKHFDTKICIIEMDNASKLHSSEIPYSVNYKFFQINNPETFYDASFVTRIVNEDFDSNVICFLRFDAIVDYRSLNHSLKQIHFRNIDAAIPYSGYTKPLSDFDTRVFQRTLEINITRMCQSFQRKTAINLCFMLKKSCIDSLKIKTGILVCQSNSFEELYHDLVIYGANIYRSSRPAFLLCSATCAYSPTLL